MEWLLLLLGLYLGVGIGFMIVYLTDTYDECEDYSLWITIPSLILFGVLIWCMFLYRSNYWWTLWKK